MLKINFGHKVISSCVHEILNHTHKILTCHFHDIMSFSIPYMMCPKCNMSESEWCEGDSGAISALTLTLRPVSAYDGKFQLTKASFYL